jgi:hypothetical protein
MWAYRSVTVPLNVFDFTVSRHRDGPTAFLETFRGQLLADCYAGYQGIALRSDGAIQRAACVTHARRKVFDAREAYPLESSLLLAQFQQLYDLEDRAQTFSPEARQTLRQAEGAPIWSAMRAWLDSDAAARVPPKSKFAEALGYLRNHWDPLRLYLTDGRLPIDNNAVEQLMKQVAVGRKNWLFIGSVAAGERAADVLTLVSNRGPISSWPLRRRPGRFRGFRAGRTANAGHRRGTVRDRRDWEDGVSERSLRRVGYAGPEQWPAGPGDGRCQGRWLHWLQVPVRRGNCLGVGGKQEWTFAMVRRTAATPLRRPSSVGCHRIMAQEDVANHDQS